MLWFFVFILFIVFFMLYCYRSHLKIDLRTFLRRGFAKHDEDFGLYTYTGKQGEGKTYSAIRFIEKQRLLNDYIVITNVHSYCCDNVIYMDNIIELIDFVKRNHGKNGKKYLIFFDEIFTVLMKGQSVNIDILAFLAQLRKRSIVFVTTAQEWSEIPITFRRFCRYQISCHMFNVPLLNFVVCWNRVNDGYNARWNSDIQDFEAPLLQTNISKGNVDVIKKYDTYEVIKNFNRKSTT